MSAYTFSLNTNRSHLVVTTPTHSYAIPYLDLVVHAPQMPAGQEQVILSTNGQAQVAVPLASSNLVGATWQDKLDDLVQNYLYMGFGGGGGTPVQSVTAGAGITITGTASDPIVSQSTTGVTPGSYTNADITVDARGNITAASNGAASSGVDSVTAGTGISLTGTAADPVVNLANTAVTPASYTYGSFTVDAQGRLTAASSGTAPLTSLTGGTGITIGGSAPTQTVTLANTAVTPGSYTYMSGTVDAQGRLTAASSGTAPLTSVTAGTGISVTGSAPSQTVALANTAVTPGSYTLSSITVDAQGRLTAASSGTASGAGTIAKEYDVLTAALCTAGGSSIDATLNAFTIPANTLVSTGDMFEIETVIARTARSGGSGSPTWATGFRITGSSGLPSSTTLETGMTDSASSSHYRIQIIRTSSTTALIVIFVNGARPSRTIDGSCNWTNSIVMTFYGTGSGGTGTITRTFTAEYSYRRDYIL